MGQDSEEAAEFVATVRGEHVAMKTWYSGGSEAAKALQSKYGAYPGLWKEVLNWPGWKEARKEYLKHTQGSESSKANEMSSIPRKRKSRWGTATNADSDNKRRSRWGQDSGTSQQVPKAPLPVLPGIPANLSPQQQQEMRQLQGRLKTINHKMDNLEQEAARVDTLPRGHRERSPSPPPIYGPDGKRKNTRAVRWRERYTAERQDILEKLMNLNPQTRQSNLLVRKRTKKIPIPIEKHPTYNFIGLLIGPRGKTQKELEAKTGCKIAIRGRGSVKEGARGRRDGKAMEGETEPLHVVITGDDQKAVDAASDMISQMLVVIDDEKNVHKQQQLRELALLNGTLKDEEFCPICAEKGHRSFECPRRFAMQNRSSVQVKCAICGDTSHPTRDCRQKPTEQKNQQEIDSEYLSFMAELDGKKPEQAQPPAPAAAAVNGAPPAPSMNGPPAPTSLPPPPTGLPPPPPGDLPLPPPPGLLPPQLANLPPPPTGGAPPPPAASNYYGGAQQQQQGPYPGHQYQQNQGQQGAYRQQQGYQQPGQQQTPQQVRPGEETSGWDPSSYYGGYGGGAGGFNWWER